jgi:hypothetical protein
MLAFKRQSDQPGPTTSSQGKQQERNPTVPQGYKAMMVPASTLRLDLVNWHLFKIVEQATLYNMEVKRPPSRRFLTALGFWSQMESRMLQAVQAAEKQTNLIFQTEPRTNHLVSIASVGEWWCFRIVLREGATNDLKEIFDFQDKELPKRPGIPLEFREPKQGWMKVPSGDEDKRKKGKKVEPEEDRDELDSSDCETDSEDSASESEEETNIGEEAVQKEAKGHVMGTSFPLMACIV